jgi:hypothetical protein
VGAAVFVMRGKRQAQTAELALLKPGSKVGDLEAVLRGGPAAELPAGASHVALPPSQAAVTQTRARELTELDPQRAAHLLRAWIASDQESKESARG